jgi:hypothetical protein
MDKPTQSVACGALSGLAMLSYSSSTIAMYILWKAIEVLHCILNTREHYALILLKFLKLTPNVRASF